MRIVAGFCGGLTVQVGVGLVGLVWGLLATQCLVCIYLMNMANSRNGFAMMTAP